MMAGSIREAMEEAFEEHEEEEKEDESSVQEQKEETESDGGESLDTKSEEKEDSSKEVKQLEGDERSTDDTVTEEEAKDAVQESKEEGAKEEKEEVGPAPVSWKPAARELWKNVPAEARVEIERREREIQLGMQQGADARKFQQEFSQAVDPFKQFIAAEGRTPIQSMQNLMRTAAGLRVGTPQEKAQIVSNVIRQFGVDIEVLDGILAGNPATNPATAGVAQMLDERLRPVNEFMANTQSTVQDTEREQLEQLNTVVEEFAGEHEFYNDVQLDMADLLDMAAKRGQRMTMQEAYDKACAYNPDIDKVIQQRKNAEVNRAQEVAAKRKAASSISGSPSGSNAGEKKPETIRGGITAAWDNLAES